MMSGTREHCYELPAYRVALMWKRVVERQKSNPNKETN